MFPPNNQLLIKAWWYIVRSTWILLFTCKPSMKLDAVFLQTKCSWNEALHYQVSNSFSQQQHYYQYSWTAKHVYFHVWLLDYIPEVSGPSKILKHRTIRLSCVHGEVEAKVKNFTWFQHATLIGGEESYVKLNANESDSGSYTCKVSYDDGHIFLSKIHNLLVVCKFLAEIFVYLVDLKTFMWLLVKYDLYIMLVNN